MKNEGAMGEADLGFGGMSFSVMLQDAVLQGLDKLIQIIPKEMMLELKNAADLKGVCINVEVVSRLLATIMEPCAFGLSPVLEAIAYKKVHGAQSKSEKIYHKAAWGRVYELDKLRLLITLENKLPKEFMAKELVCFSLIDLEANIGKIRAELRENKKNNGEP